MSLRVRVCTCIGMFLRMSRRPGAHGPRDKDYCGMSLCVRVRAYVFMCVYLCMSVSMMYKSSSRPTPLSICMYIYICVYVCMCVQTSEERIPSAYEHGRAPCISVHVFMLAM
jgi:hypothetical protein